MENLQLTIYTFIRRKVCVSTTSTTESAVFMFICNMKYCLIIFVYTQITIDIYVYICAYLYI